MPEFHSQVQMNFIKGLRPRFIQVGIWIILACVFCLYIWFQTTILWRHNVAGEDITYFFRDSQLLLNGQNPYSRILEGNMYQNDKYTTVFPLFIEISSLSQVLGLDNIDHWLAFWQWIFLASNLAIAGLFFYLFKPPGTLVVGLGVTLIWLFNRWSLYTAQARYMDIIPIFLLVLALHLLPRRRWLALFIFSLSLALKQMGIFLLPLFLIEIWNNSAKKYPFIQVGFAGLAIASLPILSSMPMMIWDLKGFAESILFSTTRNQWQFIPPVISLDMFLGLSSYAARLPMLTLMALFYLGAFLKQTSLKLAAVLVMGTFLGFNAIFFNQYFLWVLALVPLVIQEFIQCPHPADPTTTSGKSAN
jgi:hypothetical protein